MATYTAIHDGGQSSEEGFTRLFAKLSGTQNKGIVGSADLAITQNGAGAMNVIIAIGDVVIPYLNYFFHGWNTAPYTLTIAASDPTYGRISRIIAWQDRSVTINNQASNPGMLKFMEVAGTASGSPTAPNDTAVQTAVGTGNPWLELGQVAVNYSVTTILTANITDLRPLFQLSGGVGGIQFTLSGTVTVADNQTPFWVAPKNSTFTSLVARAQTAPTGAALSGRINKNGVQVATFTIAASTYSVVVTGLSLSYLAGDYFSIDITQVGSTVAGANLTVAVG